MTDYETRTTCLVVAPKGEPIFSECATHVRIIDEAAGEFIEIDQSASNSLGKIQITPSEWPVLRGAIDKMIQDCRS